MSDWNTNVEEQKVIKKKEEDMTCVMCSFSAPRRDMSHWCWPGIGVGVLIWAFWLLAFINGVFDDPSLL